MSEWTYRKYLGISIRHGYYVEGGRNDWRVVPSAATADLLRQHKLTWKEQPQGKEVLGWIHGETKDGEFLLPLPEDAQLVFFLVLVNPEFMRFTDPAMCPGQTPLRFVNAPNDLQLQLATGEVTGEIAELHQAAKRIGASAIIVLENKADRRLQDQAFKITFTARTAHWTYFAVLRGYNGGTYEIRDKSQQVQFSDLTAAVLDPLNSLGRERAYLQALSQQWPGAQIRVFRSDTLMPWQEAARPQLELAYHGEDTEVLIGHLPSVSSSDFILVSATKDTMFEQISSQPLVS